jgi:hypothetical protein
VKDVLTPKLPPPPPRHAQNRSAFSEAEHVTVVPSARTTSVLTSESQVRPNARDTAADGDQRRGRIDLDVAESAQVQDQPGVDGRPGVAVAAAARDERNVVLASPSDRRDDVLRTRSRQHRHRHHRGVALVERLAPSREAVVARQQHPSTHLGRETVERH